MPYTKEQRQAWYRANRDRVLAEKKAEYAADPEPRRKKAQQQRDRDREAWRAKEKERSRERRQSPEVRAYHCARSKQWYQANKARVLARGRNMRLKKLYGMTPEDYDLRLQQQHGGCAICSAKPKEGWPLVVDHCHETDIVRGLLCDGCNQAIGRLGDNATALHRAYRYLAIFEDRWSKASA